MRNDGDEKRLIEGHMVYRYVGPGYIVGIPARDLYPEDLVRLEEMGIQRALIDISGLYEPLESVGEVEPFCGAELANGGRCRRKVEVWGEKCWQHQ